MTKSFKLKYTLKSTEGINVDKNTRLLFVFVLNLLLPGLGFHYSGTKHNIRWLRRLGLATMVAFFFAFPLGVVLFVPYATTNYHFSLLELFAYFAVILCSATMGARIEGRLADRTGNCNSNAR